METAEINSSALYSGVRFIRVVLGSWLALGFLHMNRDASGPQKHPLQHGVVPALWIPTDSCGRLLEQEFISIIKACVTWGADGLMVLGTTGEFPHLEVDQRKRVLEVAQANSGGLPIMANVSDLRPRVALELARRSKSLGLDALSLLPPYYYVLNRADQLEFFLRTAEAAALPVFLYNFPERVGYKIGLETIAAFADRAPLLGIKQSGADFAYHRDLVALGAEKGFSVITGSDTAIPEAVEVGVSGVVSGLSNGVGDLVVKTFQQVRAGKARAEIPEASMLNEVGGLLGKLEFPYNIAAVTLARGLPIGEFKILVSSESRSRFELLVEEYRRLFKAWKLL